MNITLFGGSFNPPHLGHQIVLNQALELIPDIHQIWLLPDYQHSFPKNEQLAPAKHRLQMTKMLQNKKIKLEDCTFKQKMPGNTITHINYLQDKYPQHQFSFLLGSDNLKSFHLWPKFKELLDLMTFYIYPRAGYPLKPLYPHMKVLEHPLQIITNLSSSLIRQRLLQNLSIDYLVPDEVAKFLVSNRVYH